MKPPVIIAILLLHINTIVAQFIPRQSIEDSVIGWMKVYHFKGAKEAMKG